MTRGPGYIIRFMSGEAEVIHQDAAVRAVLTDYYRAFSTLDVQSVLPFFQEPCLLQGPQGVLSVPTRDVLGPVVATVMEELRSRGYGRSELHLQQLNLLSGTAALAIGVAIRYRVDRQELERAGVTYLLHRSDAGWKIVVLVLHDAGGVGRPTSPDSPVTG